MSKRIEILLGILILTTYTVGMLWIQREHSKRRDAIHAEMEQLADEIEALYCKLLQERK